MVNDDPVREGPKNADVEESALLPVVQFGAVTGERLSLSLFLKSSQARPISFHLDSFMQSPSITDGVCPCPTSLADA